MKRKRRVEGRRAAGRAGCSSVVFGSTNLSRECGGATIVVDGVVVVATAPRMAPKTSAIASRARWRRGLRWASELFSCPEWSELESQIAAVGRSAAPVETAPAPAVVVSKEEEDLVARARALLSDAEPAPAPTRVEPVEDDDLDIDMDLIRRARALRGASQLARTESK